MNDDFITGLRADLVAAAARHGRRGAIGRAALPLHPRAWRPAVAAGAVALAVAVAAVVIALSTLAPPVQRVARLKVVGVAQLGGQPQDAALGGGYLWVADYGGRVLRVDPVTRRVIDRIPDQGTPAVIAADDRAVWVVSESELHADDWRLLRIDPRSGRVVVTRDSATILTQLAVGAGVTWTRLYLETYEELARIGPDGAITRATRLPGVGMSLAAGRDTVWALAVNGTLTEVDGASGEILDTLPNVLATNPNGAMENAIAVDAAGAWLSDAGAGAVVQVVAGHVVRRIAVAPFTGPIARGDDAVWVATADALRRRNGLARIDPQQGTVTARIDLGHHVTNAIVPVGDTVWAIASDGTVTIVRGG